ncbi:MAG: DUF418 domain-containing protein [Candidatus Nanopelagicaceae bacterium]
MNQGREREIAPDAIRGIALLGILIVNIPFMSLFSEEGLRGVWVEGEINGIFALLIQALFTGKFYLLFAFLFGYSANFIIKGERTNRVKWVRRSIALILLGMIHFTFFWHGDILFAYGLFSLLLIPFLFRSDRTLTIWGRVIYGIFTTILTLAAAFLLLGNQVVPEEFVEEEIQSSELDQALVEGSFIDAISPRIELWIFGLIFGILLQGGFIYVAFLTGLRAGRTRFLSRTAEEVGAVRMMKVGIGLGLPVQLIAAWIMVQNEQSPFTSIAVFVASLALTFVTAPLLSYGYVGFFLWTIERAPKIVNWLTPAGRMSLTVYLSQSVVATFIFGPWGLGLFQELQIPLVVLVALIIWLSLIVLARLWLSKFDQGPMERILQRFTHWR